MGVIGCRLGRSGLAVLPATGELPEQHHPLPTATHPRDRWSRPGHGDVLPEPGPHGLAIGVKVVAQDQWPADPPRLLWPGWQQQEAAAEPASAQREYPKPFGPWVVLRLPGQPKLHQSGYRSVRIPQRQARADPQATACSHRLVPGLPIAPP